MDDSYIDVKQFGPEMHGNIYVFLKSALKRCRGFNGIIQFVHITRTLLILNVFCTFKISTRLTENTTVVPVNIFELCIFRDIRTF